MAADPPNEITQEKQITEELRDLGRHCLDRGCRGGPA